MKFTITAPATSANLGAGFDSIGIALNLYLQLKVSPAKTWSFTSSSSDLCDLPTGKSHYIYEVASRVAALFGKDDLPPCHVEMISEIPLASGLGSSASAIVCATELVNVLLDLKLTTDEKIKIVTDLEGHPDNVLPALLGGCIIAHYEESVQYVRVEVEPISFVAIIPPFQLATKQARTILPKQLSYQDAVAASSIANVSAAALLTSDWRLLGKMIKKDLFHEPHRQQLIPHYHEFVSDLEDDIYGLYISGAGPTLIAFMDRSVAKEKIKRWREDRPDFKILDLQPTRIGVTVERE